MGLETAAIVVAAVGAATSVASTVQQARAGKKQSSAMREASDVASAQQKQQEMEQRRQQVRQQRIRSAQIEQGAANQGVAGSSGELGSLGALSTNTANNLAFMSGSRMAANGITAANQRGLNAQQDASTWGAIGNISSTVTGLAAPAAGAGLSKLFNGATASNPVSSQVDTMLNSNNSIF